MSASCRTHTLTLSSSTNYALLTMADALAIVGLISNVMQFVELGHTCVKKFREVYKSAQGNTSENFELESHTQEVKILLQSVKDGIRKSVSPGASSGAERQLRDFLGAWDAVGERLLQLLEDHKMKDNTRSHKLHALREVWRLEVGGLTKEKIRVLRSGLDELQNMILLCLTATIKFVEVLFW